jgi:hypothetical protein
MSDYKIFEDGISRLCRMIEWNHRNSIAATVKKLNKVEMSENERAKLDKLAALEKIKERVTIKYCTRRFQQWYDIFVDEILVADAYIDCEAFVGKSWCNIHDKFPIEE